MNLKQFTLTIFVFLICIIAKAQAPYNDECSTASILQVSENLYCNNYIEQSTLGGTDSGLPNACGGYGDDDVWYKFEVTNSTLRINAFSTSFPSQDFIVQVFSSECGSLDSLTCNRPSVSGITDFILNDLTIGDTLYMRVFESGIGNTDMNFFACVYEPPINDECSEAIEILLSATEPVCVFANASGATDSNIPSENCMGNPDDDIWYKFTAISNNQIFTFNSAPDHNPGGYIVMELRNGECTSSTFMECAVIQYDGQYNSILSTSLDIDSTYYIRIYGSEQGTHTYGDLCINVISFEEEDDCISAELLLTNTYEYQYGSGGNLNSSTATALPTSNCSEVPYFDLWYKFVPTSNRHIVEVFAEGDVIVEAFFGNSCDLLTALGCINNVTIAGKERLDLENLIIGDTIYIRVYDAAASATNNAFNIYIMTPPLNDYCSDALLINTTNGITCNDPSFGITRIATGQGGCNGYKADDDIWYKFIATDSLHLISILNPALNCSCDPISLPVVEVYQGSCSSFSLVCNQGYTTLLSSLDIDSTYYLRVYSSDSLNGQGYFNICISEPPTNVFCDNPDTLYVNVDTTCTTSYFGNSTGQGNLYTWYTFTASSTTHIFYTTPMLPVTAIGSNLQLFDSECNYLGNMGYNYFNGVQRLYYQNFTIGQQYKIQFNAGYPTEGQFEVCIISPVENDNCANAVDVTSNLDCNCTISIDGNCNAATPNNLSGGCHPQQMDVWYRFTATTTQSIITLTGINGSVNLGGQIFGPDSCNSTPLGCFSGNFTANNLLPDKIYFVRIFATKSDGSPGEFNLCIKNISNDFCSSPRILIPNVGLTCSNPISGTTMGASASNVPQCSSSNRKDVWFQFTATSTLHIVSVNPTTTGFHPLVNVYRKSTSAASCDLNCIHSSVSCSNPTDTIDYMPNIVQLNSLTIGTTYLISISDMHMDGPSGDFNICVFTPGTTMNVWSTQVETYSTTAVANAGRYEFPMKKIKLNLTGTTTPKTVNQIVVNTNGTTNTADLLSAKLYYAGAVNSSSPQGSMSTFKSIKDAGELDPILFGTAITNPNGQLTFNGNISIVGQSDEYSRYFFLVFDIACDATIANQVNAEVESITISSTSYTPFEVINTPNNIDVQNRYFTKADGFWKDNSTWLCNAPPPLGPDILPITINHNVTVDDNRHSSNITVNYLKGLNVSNSGTLTLGQSSIGNQSGHSNKFLYAQWGLVSVYGTLNVNGYLSVGNYSSNANNHFGQLVIEGTVNIDGNDGTPAGSGTSSFIVGTPSVSGSGFINILDPSYNSSAYEYNYNSSYNLNPTVNWTLTFGGGDDNSLTNGFDVKMIDNGNGSTFSTLRVKDVYINGGLMTNKREVNIVSTLLACQNLYINQEAELFGSVGVSLDFVNNGYYTSGLNSFSEGKIICATNFGWNSFSTNNVMQRIRGSGFFRANPALPYPTSYADNSIQTLLVQTVNNIQLETPLNIVSKLMIKNGTISTTDTSILTLGSTDNYGVLCQTNSSFNAFNATEFIGSMETWTGGYINGPFRRFFNNQTPALKSIMPVGKNGFMQPIALRFNNTSPTFALAEYYNTDPSSTCVPLLGEQGVDISNTSPNGYWRVEAANSCGSYDIDFKTTGFTKRSGGAITDFNNLRMVKRLQGYDWANSCSNDFVLPTSLNKITYKSSDDKPCVDTVTNVILKVNSAYYDKNISWNIVDEENQIVYSGGPTTCASHSTNLTLGNKCYKLNININFSGIPNTCTYYDTLFTLYSGSTLVHYGLQNLFTSSHQYAFCFNKGNVETYPSNCKSLHSEFALGGANNAVGPDITPTNHNVVNNLDNGVGSLRYLMDAAVCNDTIRFDQTINGDTINLFSQLQMIDKNIIIIAEPSQNIYVRIMENEPIFKVDKHRNVELDNLKLITNGAFDGYIIENAGNLSINTIETSSVGQSTNNKTILNFNGGFIDFKGINILER